MLRQKYTALYVLLTLQDVSCLGAGGVATHQHRQPITYLQASTQQQLNEPEIISPSTDAKSALSMTLEELEEAHGGRGRARLAWDCYSEGVDPQYLFTSDMPSSTLKTSTSWSEYDNKEDLKRAVLPKPRQTQSLGAPTLSLLSDLHSHCNGRIEGGIASLVHTSTSSDGTTKLLLRLMDGLEVETVLIPFWADVAHKKRINEKDNSSLGRTTVCISSQVGCRQGCTFCATGRMGKLRSLTTDEILAQLFYAKKVVRCSNEGILRVDQTVGQRITSSSVVLPPITNIVAMGMGDAADNVDAVKGAINIMTTRELFQFSASRVTVSTVAPSPQAFLDFADSKCILAWSVHATRDELRKQLVPTTKYPMVELRQGLIDALKQRKLRTCMIEVALMDGVNDSMREAEELAEFLTYITNEVPGSKLLCNLIPYNDIGEGAGGVVAYRKPSMEKVMAFQKRLQELSVYAHVRGTRGDEENSACGQLATSRKKKEMEKVG